MTGEAAGDGPGAGPVAGTARDGTEQTDDGRVAAVIGLGLIGGSLARDLADRGWRVLAADRDADSLRAAAEAGIAEPFDLDAGPDAGQESGPATGPEPGQEAPPHGVVELVVLAAPVGAAPDVLRRVAAWLPESAAVTDVGSTKRSVAAAADAAGLAPRFVGSHPMAGDHRSGWAASRAGLFAGARVWLCPTPATRPEVVERVATLWRALGGEPAVTDAAAHDRQVAWASHLPQAVASAVAAALADAGVARDALGPGGRDVTRLAASHPDLWTGILLDNRDHVDQALTAAMEHLERMRSALAEEDAAALHDVLAAGRAWTGR